MSNLGGRLRIRAALFLGVGLGLTGLVLIAYGANVFKPWEFDTVNARFAVRGTHEPPVPLAIVGVNDVTFGDYNTRPQDFRRLWYAQTLDRLREDGARAVLYDFQFSEPSLRPDDDWALVNAAAAAHDRTVFAATETDEQGNSNVFGGGDNIPDPLSLVFEPGLRLLSLGIFRIHAGNALLPEDGDGATRRVSYKVDGLKSLGIVGAELVTGKAVHAGDLGRFGWIDFVGPPGTVPLYSLSRVAQGKFKPGTFRGKLVVVGPTAPSLQDIHSTSTGQLMVGPELQANVASTAIAGFPLQSPPRWFDVLLIVLCGVIVPLAGLRLSLRGTLFFGLGAAVALFVGAQLAFQSGWVILFIYPALALILSTIGALAAYYVLSIFERQRTRDTFARFVPESVVDQLLAAGDGSGRLATTQVFGTCMFTDIRGFTTFSEGHSAPEVIDVLNRYLSEMSDAILRNGGTLASFLGDGFMAVFGAPLAQDDHADRALAAAREIVEERLPRFNAQLQGEGFPGFNMGIGLNSGPFMSGNVGSEQRLQYTVIGDTINTASRIEGLTKGSGHIMFLADSTREALVNPPEDLVYVDEFDIRGRQSRVKLWSIEGRVAEAPVGAAQPEPAPEGVPAAPAGI
jgi:adenylate cyclase